MALRRWDIKRPDRRARLALERECGLSSLAAGVLCARGADTPESARGFLKTEIEYEEPDALADVGRAADRIARAIADGERIAVFGDYDVDGVSATALMYRFLQSSGADVVCQLPAREGDGYGLSQTAIDNLLRYGVALIVTVDNGISAHREIEYARSKGIEAVVCDHHRPGESLPPAVAVVDPLRADDKSVFKGLAGVGVAAKLAAAVEGCSFGEIIEEFGWLAALGTVSDIMPLVGENRRIISEGLAQMRDGCSPGITALCARAGVPLEGLGTRALAFTVAPRLNAAGRMGDSSLALRLLLSEEDDADGLADELERLNALRKRTEQEITERIEEIIGKNPSLLDDPVLVVADEGVHSGVAGIVCSRLAGKYARPAVVISIEDGVARGSGRSVDGFSLYDALSSCRDLMQRFGGHTMAAGFTMAAERVDELRQRLRSYCKTCAPPRCPTLCADMAVEIDDIDVGSVKGLDVLKPFGCKNEEPVFAIEGASVEEIAPLGEAHSRITLKKGGKVIKGALFGIVPAALGFAAGASVDAAFNLSVYEAQGHKPVVSVKFADIRPAGADDALYGSYESYLALKSRIPVGDEARGLISLSRERVGEVYRALRRAPLPCDPSAACFAGLGVNLGALLAACDTLCELGLARRVRRGGVLFTEAVACARKKELADSFTYSLLCEAVK